MFDHMTYDMHSMTFGMGFMGILIYIFILLLIVALIKYIFFSNGKK